MSVRLDRSGLVLPFTAVGAAAGWLSAEVLTNPRVDLAELDQAWLAAAVPAVAAAAIGECLGRWSARHMDRHPPRVTWAVVAISMLMGGALAGATIGRLDNGVDEHGAGAVTGALSALVLVPVAVAVIAVAKRAERARLGSLVAGVDRRATWSIPAAMVAILASGGALDWTCHGHAPPLVALAMAGAGAAIVLAALVADVVTLRRIVRLGGDSAFEPHDLSGPLRAGEPDVDLGLGDEVRAQLVNEGAYRSRPRAIALLRGSVDEAREAASHAIRRGTLGLAGAALALATHAIGALTAVPEEAPPPAVAEPAADSAPSRG